LRNEIFGRKSEKRPALQDERQGRLFDEVDSACEAPEETKHSEPLQRI
jgi:hypothetical protein